MSSRVFYRNFFGTLGTNGLMVFNNILVYIYLIYFLFLFIFIFKKVFFIEVF